MTDRATAGRYCAVLVVACVWAGFLAGVSFLATPVKFLAPSLDLPVALDVGRQTFYALNRSEIALGAILLVLVLRSPRNRLMLALAGVAVLIVLAQTVWLIPALDARVGIVLAGSTPEPSSLHTIYVVVEVAKLLALIALIGITARALVVSSTRVEPEALSLHPEERLPQPAQNP